MFVSLLTDFTNIILGVTPLTFLNTFTAVLIYFYHSSLYPDENLGGITYSTRHEENYFECIIYVS